MLKSVFIRKTASALSTFFGLGLVPFAPGTLGSLATLPLAFFIASYFSLFFFLLFTLFVSLIAIVVSHIYVTDIKDEKDGGAKDGGTGDRRKQEESRQKDPGEIVIDEVAGQLLALCLVPPEWHLYLVSFVLFRLFDILKPPPLRFLERLPTGLGIVLDDLVAGIYALLTFLFLQGLILQGPFFQDLWAKLHV